jgi:glucosamine kinase
MAEALFVGVDGGASHSRARIRDQAGRCLGEGSAGPANTRLGLTAALDEIVAACRAAASAAGLAESDLGRLHAGFGLAGVTGADERDLVLAQPLPFASVAADSDAYTAWLGACGGRDGAILIVGTGSCGLAVVGGRRINVGGWGGVISDDGGGAAIGREAVRRALWTLEGLAPATGLADAILDEFHRDPERIVSWAAAAKPADFARHTPTVFAWAERLDPLALALLSEAAAAIGRMVVRLLDCGAPSVCLVSGLAEPMAPWLPPPLRAKLAAPAGDALDGAILLARQNLEAARATP